MPTVKENLVRFLSTRASSEQRSDDRSAFVALIAKHRLAPVLLDELRQYDVQQYNRAIHRMATQRRRNEVFAREINTLSKLATQSGVKLVIVKGLPLALDLYSPPETRSFHDIDILVRIGDAEAALDLLGRQGYRICSDGLALTLVPEAGALATREMAHRFIYEPPQVLHFPPLVRRESEDRPSQDLDPLVELHVNLFPRHWTRSQQESTQLVSRAVKAEISGTTMWILELHDRLLHLFLHIAFHYSWDCVQMFNFGRLAVPRLRGLHEIAMFIERHGSEIDWSVCVDRARALEWCGQVGFGAHVLTHIYPGLIPLSAIRSLRKCAETEKRGFFEGVFPLLMDAEPDAPLANDPRHFLGGLAASLRRDAVELECPGGDNPSAQLGSFVIGDVSDEPDTTQTKPRTARRSTSPVSAHVRVWWSPENLYFAVRVFEQHLRQFFGPSSWEHYDVELMFDLGDRFSAGPFIRRFVVHPVRQDGGLDVITSWKVATVESEPTGSGSDAPDWPSASGCRYSALHDDGYEVRLEVAWSDLRIAPSVGTRLGFDMAIQHQSYPRTGSGDRRTWATDISWDVSQYGVLRLV